MKVYISADIEGVTGATIWDECSKTCLEYPKFSEQMTNEVIAVCEGAIAAGATEIVVKDSHDSGTNINISQLPEEVEVIRGWSGHPYSMVEGVDSSFDAILFVGYHSAAGRPGNPLSHTMTGKPQYIKINGKYASEFMIYSYAAALEGVPTVFLAGDKMLCEDSAYLHSKLMTVAVKEGEGGLTKSLSPKKSLKLIKETVEKALKQNLTDALTILPKSFDVELNFRDHRHACKMAYYPGMVRESASTLRFISSDYFEVLRMFQFVL